MTIKTDEEILEIFQSKPIAMNYGFDVAEDVMIGGYFNGFRACEQSLQSEIESQEARIKFQVDANEKLLDKVSELKSEIQRLDKSNMEKEGRIVRLEDEIERMDAVVSRVTSERDLAIKNDEYRTSLSVSMESRLSAEIQRLTTLSERQTLDIVKLEKCIDTLKSDNAMAWNNSITPILEKNYCTLGTASHASSLLASEYVALKSKYDELEKKLMDLENSK